jgi:hypothetical protein
MAKRKLTTGIMIALGASAAYCLSMARAGRPVVARLGGVRRRESLAGSTSVFSDYRG